MNIQLSTMGADPEFFGSKDGVIVALSPDDIPGTKEKPHKINNRVSIQLDNVLGELTFPPADSPARFQTHCYHAKLCADQFLHDKGIKAVWNSSHVFDKKELRTLWGKTFGCEEDFSADVSDHCLPIDRLAAKTLRGAGGHLHFGFDEVPSNAEIIQLVRMCDFSIGAGLVLSHNDPES